ncbi:polyprenyl synthetase family protein [bacterium]|nr:polyprenyl synthetase family protein [bacterium]
MQGYSEILNIMQVEINLLKKELISDISIDDKVLEFLNSPSKHIRPLLSFLYLKASGKNIDETQIKYQSAIELVHNASLIHDDVIDESTIRRGKNSLNEDLGNKIAVISGDYILSVAMEKVLSLGSLELVEMFCKTLKNMTKGEISQYKMIFEIPELKNYLTKTEQKTADLFDLSLKGSLKLAGINNDYDFAKFFGMAFQIKDDLNNYNTSKTDVKEGIYTAPVIFSNSLEVTDIGLEKTRSLLNNYIDKALKSMDILHESIYKEALSDLVKGLKDE